MLSTDRRRLRMSRPSLPGRMHMCFNRLMRGRTVHLPGVVLLVGYFIILISYIISNRYRAAYAAGPAAGAPP